MRVPSLALSLSATEIAVQPERSLRSTLAIAAMVFQLRVVTETPYSRSSAPRNPMTFMWRLYIPMTNTGQSAPSAAGHR